MDELMDRVNGRVVAVVLAVLLAAIATIALSDYVNGQRDQILEENEAVTVWVATLDMVPGTSVDFGIESGFFVERTVGRSAIELLDGPVTQISQYSGQQVVRPVTKGSILIAAHFGVTIEQEAIFQVPDGMVAMSIDVGLTPGVANFIDPGDFVSIVTHLGGATGDDETEVNTGAVASRILLQNVEILAIGRRLTQGGQSVARNDEALTVTVAVTPVDAERLVYAQLSSTLYLLLEPEGGGSPATTIGRNGNNLFTGRS